MREFFAFIAAVVILFAGVIAFIVLITVANSHWNCSSFSSAGEETKVIAGECFVKNEDGSWEIFDSYIRRTHVRVKEE